MVQKIFSALTVLMALLTGCERYTKGEQSFTSLKIEGKEYKTPVMYENKHYITGGKELFDFDGDSFKIRLEETMSSGSEKIGILLRIIGDGMYSIGERYHFPSTPTSVNGYSTARITFTENGIDKYYYAMDGWMELDDVEEVVELDEYQETRAHYYKIDGRFAFTAREEHSGRIIEIKDGTFHNAMFVNRPGLTISTNWRKK